MAEAAPRTAVPALMDRLRNAVRGVRARTDLIPRVALVLDPALGDPSDGIAVTTSIPGSDLPFAVPVGTRLVVGRLDGTPVAAWTGGVDRATSVRAVLVRLARLLGADVLVLALRVRALTPDPASDVGSVEDHVGLLVPNPLVGPNLDEMGPRFPDMSQAYDPALRALAAEEAARVGATLTSGVYAAHPDPNLATPAEYRLLTESGVRWLGNGGVAETIVARHAGMRVLGLVGLPGSEASLAALVRSVVGRIT